MSEFDQHVQTGLSKARDRSLYAHEVWTAFLQRTGQPQTRLMSPAEWDVMRGWLDAEVPLRIVLRAFADTAGRGKTLGYYRGSVEEAMKHWTQAVGL